MSIKVNVIDQYWFDDDENAELSENGQRKFHTIEQTPMIFEDWDEFGDYLEFEGLELLDSWYSYPDSSIIIDYYTGERLEKSVHIIDEDDWHKFQEPTVEYEVVH